jgi:hypothetical protein
MKRAILILALTIALTGCGTLNGAGTVFEGVAEDFYSVGGWLGG